MNDRRTEEQRRLLFNERNGKVKEENPLLRDRMNIFVYVRIQYKKIKNIARLFFTSFKQ